MKKIRIIHPGHSGLCDYLVIFYYEQLVDTFL
jgi:hypothetical protein